MYLDRVRKVLKSFDENNKRIYIKELQKIMRLKRKDTVKYKEAEKMLDRFIARKNIVAESLESLLLALDNFSSEGALTVLKGKGATNQISWKDKWCTFIRAYRWPEEIENHFDDKLVVDETIKTFKNTTNFCHHAKKDEFVKNLNLFNQFLQIKLENEKKGGH
ncbi:hypothetical protein [Salipaludibacillus sp. CF4.18]|uniref:hypothetical protein n=1 Tax=Salipaludibacillus sp. CF4.18 TaxID=3373081 RepID=UPI003EE71619